MTDTLDELERLLAKATPGPWAVDEDNREGYEWNNHIVNNEGTIAFMAHKPGDNEQLEAAAHLIVTAVNALPELLKAVRRVGELEALLAEAQPLVAAMEFLESRAYHYGRSYDEPSPAEWGISVSYQETRDMNPGAQFDADITEYHRQNLEEDDEDEPGQFLSLANRIARAALKGNSDD